MKFFHLSDLHIGKRLFGFSLLEDQEYILNQILELSRKMTPDAFLLAGDIYDKAVPSAEAVQLFDRFLTELSDFDRPIFIISGNHDSAERLAFGAGLLRQSEVFVSPPFDGEATPVTLNDEYGPLDVYMLPFIKPNTVRPFFPDLEIATYQDAAAAALGNMRPDPEHRNVLIAHQFVAGAVPSDSEELSIGGAEQIDAALFSDFDYVALGHIHRAQQVTRSTVRYCGAPLACSFSESGQEKSVTVVELKEKGSVSLSFLPLTPKRRLRKLRGSYMELTDRRNYAGTATDDYLHIILTDEQDIPDAMGKLRAVYPNIMQLSYDNARTAATGELSASAPDARRNPLQMFDDLYNLQTGAPLNDSQRQYLRGLIENIWEETER